MIGRAGRTLGWFGFLATTIVALRLAGAGELSGPPLTSLDALGSWAESRETAAGAVALVRLGAEWSAWYVLAVSAAHTIASLLRFEPAHALADALALPAVRRLVHGALGMSLLTVSAGPPPQVPAHPAVDLLPDVDAGEVAQEQVRVGTATMRPLEQPAPTGTAAMVPVITVRTWTVHDGESFWTIASDVLEQAWGRPPGDHDIDPFWRALVEANRDRLVDRSDPDLIVPGQVFDVPPIPQPG